MTQGIARRSLDFKLQKTGNKELAMLDIPKEVIKGCNAIQKEQFEAPTYQETISNLQSYFQLTIKLGNYKNQYKPNKKATNQYLVCCFFDYWLKVILSQSIFWIYSILLNVLEVKHLIRRFHNWLQ